MLNEKNLKELLVIAKDLQIVGRYEMKKGQLLEAIELAQDINVIAEKVNEAINIEDAMEKEEHWEINSSMVKVNSSVLEGALKTPAVSKSYYIANIKRGVIIAFKVGCKTISGMVEEIHKNEIVAECKNGMRYIVLNSNIVWVKTGDRWPRGVYLDLKGVVEGEHKTNCKGSPELRKADYRSN